MKIHSFKYGISVREAEGLHDFLKFISETLAYRHFIWRGQRDSSWGLEPTLDRTLKELKKLGDVRTINDHLDRFRFTVQGKRGPNPKTLEDENEWWALGQHHGLKTPLLDWTKSPFVALFFAFESAKPSSTGKRTIYGISKTSLKWKSDAIKKTFEGKTRPPIIEFVETFADDNPELVNQGGLFSRSPSGLDIEEWIKKNFDKNDKNVKMWKILFNDSERVEVLRYLNRMNVNHLSLFPDLYGSSKFVNFDLEINKY